MAFFGKNYKFFKLLLFIIAIAVYAFLNRFDYSYRDNIVRTNIFTGEVSVIEGGEVLNWRVQSKK